jgi:protein tyrosine/serine phosphatase
VKKKNPIRAFVIVLIIVICCVLLVRHFKIPDLNIVSQDKLYTSGQPRGMDYARLLYKYHIATIINLRSSAEHREQNWYNEEMTWVRTNGVKYIEMPLERNPDDPGHFPDAELQQRFLAIMADKESLPVLVHDGRGESRVAMFAAIWLAKKQQRPLEQVLATAEKIKTGPLNGQETAFIRGLFQTDSNSK